MKRNTDLTPTQKEQTAVLNLVTKIQAVLDSLIITPGSFDACVSILSINGFPKYFSNFDVYFNYYCSK